MTEIRLAVPNDGREIARVQVDSWKIAYRGIIPDDYLDRLDVERRVAVWESFVRDETGRLFVACGREGIVGFCHLIPSRDADAEQTAEIAAIYIDPNHWRKGAGRMLCSAACASSKEQGFRWLTLWVLIGNSPGRRFYEAMGFRSDGTIKSEERPGCVLEEIRYRMCL